MDTQQLILTTIPSHLITEDVVRRRGEWECSQPPDGCTIDDFFPRAYRVYSDEPIDIEGTDVPGWNLYFDGIWDRWFRDGDPLVEIELAQNGAYTRTWQLVQDARTPAEHERDEDAFRKAWTVAVKTQSEAASNFKGPRSPRADEAFDYAIDAPNEDSEGMFPYGEISLVCGASGAGKSTWSLDMLEKQAAGEPILGRATKKLRYFALLTDRGPNALRRTARRMRLNLDTLPHASLKPGPDVTARIEQAYLAAGKPDIVYLEGIDLLVGENTAENVGPLIDSLQEFAYHYHVVIIGTIGVPKMKPNEKFTQKRERVIGTQLWGRVTETLVYIDRDHNEEENTTQVSVLLRQGKEEQYQMRFDRGRLVRIGQKEIEQKALTENQQMLLQFVMDSDGDFTITQARRFLQNKASHETVKRRLDRMVEQKYLTRRVNKTTGKMFYRLSSQVTVN